MTDLEDRLRDAFRAVDAKVVVPARREDVPVERHIGRWLVAAAAVVALVSGSAIFAGQYDDDQRIGVVSNDTPVSPAEFDARASEVCRKIFTDRSGVAPRFATLDAYRVVSEQRGALIASAIGAVAALAPPSDVESLPARVIRTLRVAANNVEVVQHYVDVDDLDNAIVTWPGVDRAIDDALIVLFDHGATGCQP